MAEPARIAAPRAKPGPKPGPKPGSKPRPRRRRRALRWLGWGSVGLVTLVAAGLGTTGFLLGERMEDSLPRLDGEARVAGLRAPVTIERDSFGVPTLVGESRRDVAFATGFVHAQDRLFQMDLLRSAAAGELGELAGGIAFRFDRAARVYRLRERARRALAAASPEIQELLAAYAAGVDAGAGDLAEPPFEYAVLGAEPRPWRAEDSFLVLLAMFMELQDVEGRFESLNTEIREVMPPEMADFLLPWGTEWDAPLIGEPLPGPPPPGPEVYTLRSGRPDDLLSGRRPPRSAGLFSSLAGSNGWAVAGSRTADGRALLANDVHLGMLVPNFWYRASFRWPDGESGEHRVTGATLPGLPAMVAASNGRVAWGITSSVIDAADLVVLEIDPDDPGVYLTPEGPRRFERFPEVLRARGQDEETVEVEWTIWGPVVREDHRGRRRALRSVIYEEGAVDLEVLGLETAGNVDEAVEVARRSGVPALNLMVADAEGRVGWTLLGRVPKRVGFDGRTAGSWADGRRRWEGLLPPAEVPRLVDPEDGLVWTANNRVVGGETLSKLGDGGYLLGARARQIRDSLRKLDAATAEDMRHILLDDRALFYERWRELLLDVLPPTAARRRSELRRAVEEWGGRAAVDSVGFRAVWTFREEVAREALAGLTAAAREVNPELDYFGIFFQHEGPLWRLIEERPPHLLPPPFDSWDELLSAAVDRTLEDLGGGPLAERTWGEHNRVAARHPFSLLLPPVGRWLDMPERELPGAEYLPRLQEEDFGSTLRMVVSPGREEEGLFHIPGGQSGNPRSPHYRDGWEIWVRGEPAPFLPGPAAHLLRLEPGSIEKN